MSSRRGVARRDLALAFDLKGTKPRSLVALLRRDDTYGVHGGSRFPCRPERPQGRRDLKIVIPKGRSPEGSCIWFGSWRAKNQGPSSLRFVGTTHMECTGAPGSHCHPERAQLGGILTGPCAPSFFIRYRRTPGLWGSGSGLLLCRRALRLPGFLF